MGRMGRFGPPTMTGMFRPADSDRKIRGNGQEVRAGNSCLVGGEDASWLMEGEGMGHEETDSSRKNWMIAELQNAESGVCCLDLDS